MKKNIEELFQTIKDSIDGEIKWDKASRILYSTDASIYQIEPLAVVFPKTFDDINTCVEIAANNKVPVLARGAGTSLSGQAVGHAIIIDCSRYLYREISIDPERHMAVVDAGVILASLNKRAAEHNLKFGPDPASAERATIGGSIANNATGAHSIIYGMAADHILAADVVLSDGSLARFEPIRIDEAVRRSKVNSREGAIYRSALTIRERYAEAIKSRWPKTWRRAGGYALNYLIPWSPSQPPFWDGANFPLEWGGSVPEVVNYPPISEGYVNLAPLIAGSEGTLAILKRCELSLVSIPCYSILVVLGFPDVRHACDQVEALLAYKPSAIELIPANMINLAWQIPAYAHQLSWIEQLTFNGQFPSLLVAEFSGDEQETVLRNAKQLLKDFNVPSSIISSPEMQNQVWGIRKVGLGILMSAPGDEKPVPFIEDISVPVENLSTLVVEIEKLLRAYNTHGDFYAHASAGCLHLRPILNLKTLDGIRKMREFATHAVELVIKLGGSISGEHGAGLSRSEWLPDIYGTEILEAFRMFKNAADPDNILNPGKILDAPPMHINLRYQQGVQPLQWKTIFDFSPHNGFSGAIEMCNGAGVCRKDTGIMCPSYQATRDEMHSPRGRANLLRNWVYGNLLTDDHTRLNILFDALDLCLACKGCKSECPSSVDIAKLKYEFLEHYYSKEKRKHLLRDLLFAHLDKLSRAAVSLRPLGEQALAVLNSQAAKSMLGLAEKRNLPAFDIDPFSRKLKKLSKRSAKNGKIEQVLLLIDPFTEYFNPELGVDTLRLLEVLGIEVRLISIVGTGRPLISKGFLKAAGRHAEKLLSAIERADPEGNTAIIGLEPSEIYTLSDEYLDFFPDKKDLVKGIAERSYLIDEYLIRPGVDGRTRLLRIDLKISSFQSTKQKVYLHGHCYQKSRPPHRDGFPVGVDATRLMLEMLGFQVEVIGAGCCGMAGAFGYESEHYALSLQIGEYSLFPAVRKAEQDAFIVAPGYSCQTQISDGTGRKAWHPITLAAVRLWENKKVSWR